MLIEDAIEFYRQKHLLPLLPPPAIKLGKLHGSANWIPDLGNQVFKNLIMENVGAIGNPSIRYLSREAAINALRNDDQFMPDMCLYMFGKESLYTSTRTTDIASDWNTSLDQSDIIYVCGVAINTDDKHIWDGLIRNRHKIHYFGTKYDIETFRENLAVRGEDNPTFSSLGIIGLAEHLEEAIH